MAINYIRLRNSKGWQTFAEEDGYSVGPYKNKRMAKIMAPGALARLKEQAEQADDTST